MDNSISYLRGALIAYPPGGYPQTKRVIPFRFNPESLSRQISIEQGQGGAGAESGAGAGGSAPDEQGADATSGTLKESFTVQLRVDFADRIEGANSLPPELGVAPRLLRWKSCSIQRKRRTPPRLMVRSLCRRGPNAGPYSLFGAASVSIQFGSLG